MYSTQKHRHIYDVLRNHIVYGVLVDLSHDRSVDDEFNIQASLIIHESKNGQVKVKLNISNGTKELLQKLQSYLNCSTFIETNNTAMGALKFIDLGLAPQLIEVYASAGRVCVKSEYGPDPIRYFDTWEDAESWLRSEGFERKDPPPGYSETWIPRDNSDGA